MYQRLIGFFNLGEEQEPHELIIENLKKGVVFNGTNLWVLVFAIFVASVGLNVNSTAVIIGAMLISPLMGPIMGIGLGLGINDLNLIRRAIKNLGFAVAASLLTSMFYFILSPLNEAHSELFARTSPNIYDVLIALFGGLAGIVATTSKQKGNVLQGVAIATALMPPLCTAGYGLATLQFNFFFGAFYLFIINTVFISLSTYLMVRFLKFPVLHLSDPESDRRMNRIITGVTVLTVIPSIYLGYQLSRNESYKQSAQKFINEEIVKLDNSYLLKQEITPTTQTISIVIGGADLEERDRKDLDKKLALYDLEGTTLKIENRLSFEKLDKEGNSKITYLSNELAIRQERIRHLESSLDSLHSMENQQLQVSKEILVQYPSVKEAIVVQEAARDSSGSRPLVLCLRTQEIPQEQIETMRKWLKIRLGVDTVKLFVDSSK